MRVKPPLALLLLALPFLSVAAICGGGGGKKATPTPATPAGTFANPLDAMKPLVEARYDREFIGDCTQAKNPDDIGKLCGTFRGQRGDMVAYDVGPAFGQPLILLIVQNKPSVGWTVTDGILADPAKPTAAIPWPLRTGEQVVVYGNGPDQCLRARQSPGLQGVVVTCQPDGVRGVVTEGPVDADGYKWWKVTGDGWFGWMAADWLRYPDTLPVTPGAAGTPGAGETAAPAGTPVPP